MLFTITSDTILRAKGNPVWAVAKTLKDGLPGRKIEVATEIPVLWIDEVRYPFPQSLINWIKIYARWRVMEPLTFDLEIGDVQKDSEVVGD